MTSGWPSRCRCCPSAAPSSHFSACFSRRCNRWGCREGVRTLTVLGCRHFLGGTVEISVSGGSSRRRDFHFADTPLSIPIETLTAVSLTARRVGRRLHGPGDGDQARRTGGRLQVEGVPAADQGTAFHCSSTVLSLAAFHCPFISFHRGSADQDHRREGRTGEVRKRSMFASHVSFASQ